MTATKKISFEEYKQFIDWRSWHLTHHVQINTIMTNIKMVFKTKIPQLNHKLVSSRHVALKWDHELTSNAYIDTECACVQ